MELPDDNIEIFNTHVRTLVKNLNARGEHTTDLLVNLFKGYMAAKDHRFNRYIQQKQDDYDDEGKLDPEKLMMLAHNKYKVLVQQHMWTSKSVQDERIMALELKISNMNKREQRNQNGQAQNGNPKTRPRKRGPMSPEDFARFKKFIFNKPDDISKPQRFKTNGAPYWWCRTHNRMCKQGCEKFNGYNVNRNTEYKSNPVTETTTVSHENEKSTDIDVQGMCTTMFHDDPDEVLTIPEV